MARVFMSYRREDTAEVARRLTRALKADLGRDQVFLDGQDLWGGDDWRAVVRERVRGADAVVALVGHRWAGGDDGRRIFDDDDVVRWELKLALEADRGLVPTMVDGARLPDELPPDIAALRGAQWLDLDPSDSPLHYQVLLADLFYKTVRQGRDVMIVTDDGDEAELRLDELAALLKDGALGPDARELVRTASGGFSRLRLKEAATQWPDVIVLRDPDRSSAILDAREAGARRNTRRVLVVSSLTGLLGFLAGTLATGPTVPPDAPPPPTPPSQQPNGMNSTPAGGPESGSSAVSQPTDGVRRVLVQTWRGLSKVYQGSVLAAGAVAAGAAITVLWPDPPIVLVGAWDVTDFEEELSSDDVNSTVDVAGGRMRFERVSECSEEPCALVVTEGPQLLRDVVMEPIGGGSRYVGDRVPIIYVCEGTEIPREQTEAALTATYGGDDDTLEFIITFAVTDAPEQCGTASAEYVATATRVVDD